MSLEKILGPPDERIKPVLCHICPFAYHCPVEQREAVIHVLGKEGKLLTDEERTEFIGAWELVKKAAEHCPVVKGWRVDG